MRKAFRVFGFFSLCPVTCLFAQQLELNRADRRPDAMVDPPSVEAFEGVDSFDLPRDLRASLWAAEPMLANPVALSFDERGRLFVAETGQSRAGVLDIRDHPAILERDLASRTVEDLARLIEEAFGEEAVDPTIGSARVRLIEDTDHDGVADASHVFADGFNTRIDGMAAGILARQDRIWLARIPSLWRLTPDASGTRAADREEVLRGFGVHIGFAGHDLHGLAIGPDGKLYFSAGDRGAHVESTDAELVDLPDTGAVFRCDPDGNGLEVVATGLRNPTDLAFDDFGNLFTVDSDSDDGDPARLVYVVEGSDSGWQIGYQSPLLGKGDPWMRDGLRKACFEDQSAHIFPPVCNIMDGPAGLAYYPGTGLTEDYVGNFFLCHFNGSLADSGIQTYALKPRGAGFEVTDSRSFLRGAHPSDVTFGPDNRLYFSAWVSGGPIPHRGHIYVVEPLNQETSDRMAMEETSRLIVNGMDDRSPDELAGLLGHADRRVRLAAQFELANRGEASLPVFQKIVDNQAEPRLARLHALWGMGQLAGDLPGALNTVPPLLLDKDREVRAQAAKLIGDTFRVESFRFLVAAFRDPEPRVAFFAAQSLGKLERKEAIPDLIGLLRQNDNQDVVLRHAIVIALARLGTDPVLASTVNDPSQAVRLGGLLAYRRMEDPAVASFLEDFDPTIVREAARAINDMPIEGAMPALAALLELAPLDDAPLVLRAINAHFRLGKPENATALAEFAGRPYVPASFRAEALRQLGMWAAPPARDRLTGLYRPLPPRESEPAKQALSDFLSHISGKAPEEVQVATIHAVADLEIPGMGHALWDVVYQSAHPVSARIAALQALEKLDDLRLEVAAQTAGRSECTELRLAALPILARRHPAVSLPTLEFLASNGTVAEQRLVFSILKDIEDPRADKILIDSIHQLVAGEIPVEVRADLRAAAAAKTDPGLSALVNELGTD